MRVTGGKYKGRLLKSAPGMAARPTTDKVRQSIFNILMNDIEGKTVLDLFAGAGTLGIEALSRGAVSAVFIEIAHQQFTAIRQNLKSLDLQEELIQADYLKGCRQLAREGRQFDIIFADPPYEKIPPGEVIAAVLEYNLLAPGGFLIIEHKAGVVNTDDKMTLLKNRKFGQTEVTFYASKKE
ncbi:Methyltransferase [Candidatus Zixiibacteriota bacterium]|nr:Methyltransferase [candidate division Zixibacteria bacterium]